MAPRIYLLAAAVLCLVSACSKQTAQNPAGVAEPPRRNAAESLGFAAESPEGYFQRENPPASASPPAKGPAPNIAPKSTASASSVKKPIRHTLTAKDGRHVEAELLARNDTEVKFRRIADATEFTFPLEKLSDADQAFIRNSALPSLASR